MTVKTKEIELKRVYMAAYGSLRKSCYNFVAFERYFGGQNFKWVETLEVGGFKLYSLGLYPAVKLGKPKDKLTIDILEMTPEVFERITSMESGAGYKPLTLQIKEYNDITMFIYAQHVSELTKVPDGDWVKYLEFVQGEKRRIVNKVSM